MKSLFLILTITILSGCVDNEVEGCDMGWGSAKYRQDDLLSRLEVSRQKALDLNASLVITKSFYHPESTITSRKTFFEYLGQTFKYCQVVEKRDMQI